MLLYLYLFLGLGILLLGGKYLVDGASSLALRFGLTPGLVGLTVVAFGTSAPELLVSISAAMKGNSDIAIGNVIGSNISNISLILGVSALVYPIAVHPSVLKLDYLVMVLSSALFFALAYNGEISRLEGGFLVLLLIAVNIYFIKKLSPELDETADEVTIHPSFWKGFVFFAIGVVGLFVGSELLVTNAVKISQAIGVSERVIGVTIVAIGTSLPEMVTSVIAALKRNTDLAIGNILGSNIFNVLCIIGVTGLIRPVPVSALFIQKDFLWMMGFTLLLYPFLRSKSNISKWEGLLLLGLYGTYVYLIL